MRSMLQWLWVALLVSALPTGAQAGGILLLQDHNATMAFHDGQQGGDKNPDGFSHLSSDVTSQSGAQLSIPTLTEWNVVTRVDSGTQNQLSELVQLTPPTLGDMDGDAGSESLTASYQDPAGFFQFDLEHELVGDPAGVLMAGFNQQWTINKLVDDQDFSLHLFLYIDFDLFDPLGENIMFDPSGMFFTQQEFFIPGIPFDPPDTQLVFVGVGAGASNPAAHEASVFSDLRDSLYDDAGMTVLNNMDSVADAAMNDLVAAFEIVLDFSSEFSQETAVFGFNFEAGQTESGGGDVPEPSAALLLGASLAALAFVRRRRE